MSTRYDDSQWGIRTKVRTAIAGIGLLIISQIALTTYYLVEMWTSSEIMSDCADFVRSTDSLRQSVRTLELPDPQAIDKSVKQEFTATASKLGPLARQIGETHKSKYPVFETQMLTVASLLERGASEAEDWFERVLRTQAALSGQEEMDRLFVGKPRGPNQELELVEAAFKKTMNLVQRELSQTINSARADLITEQDYVKQVVNHANRYLISLSMISLIYLTLLFGLLPERLVSPIKAITRIIHQAELGRLDAKAPVYGHDEVARLAETFNNTMTRLRIFDDKKKGRIVEDNAKIGALLQHLPWPTAILTTGYTIDHANPAFHELLGLTAQDIDTPLHRIFSEGQQSLRELLDQVVKHQRQQLDRTIMIVTADGNKKHMKATIDTCRDRQGRVGHIVLMLRDETKEELPK